jgi:GSH-dependent disulfide-bond oxidoreductase
MIELYGMGSPNVVKIYIALEELGLPYTVRPVDVFAGAQFDPAFLRLNPMAKVPVITDSDGPGGKPCTLFESGAILHYLAEKTGRLLPKDAAAKYQAIEWMMVQMTTLGPMFGQDVHFMRFAPAGNEYSQSRYTTQVHKVFEVMDRRLAEQSWLGGAEYGIADIATYPWARNIPVLLGAEAAEKYPNVMRWVGVISERPAVKRALAAVDDVRAKTTQFDKAEARDLDRLFGRGQYSTA